MSTLIQSCKKLINRNLNYYRVGTPEGGALIPCNHSRVQLGNSSFLARTAPVKNHGLFVY